MSTMALAEKLRALISHPSTPENERSSAKARLAELVAKEEDRRKKKVTGFCGLKVKADKGSARQRIPQEWPFGWTGLRVPVDYEFMVTPDGGACVGWKCPRCGAHVTRNLSSREVLALSPLGDRSRLLAAVKKMTDGRSNQLCYNCSVFLTTKMDGES